LAGEFKKFRDIREKENNGIHHGMKVAIQRENGRFPVENHYKKTLRMTL
jgi:hypothetical protein